ncbi:MAG: isoprenylcysteine carboxylmethyltransferase family protein [Caldilineaceae bacterium]
MSKNQLGKAVLGRLVASVLCFCALFFLPAGTLFYWEAWLYMTVLLIPMALFGIYLFRHNPALLERRMKMREQETQQRWIIATSIAVFLVLLMLPGFDRRFGWSAVPTWLVLAADLLILLGYLFVVWTLLENEYAARTVEVEAQQRVITTGPYALVRHPMYVGIILITIASALALGSYWALIPAALFLPLIIARILNEEAVLHRELTGYDDYCQAVRYRLLPGVW